MIARPADSAGPTRGPRVGTARRRAAWAALVAALFAGACSGPSARGPGAVPAADTAAVAGDTAWTTIAARLGDWPFLVPIPQLPPMKLGNGALLGVKASDCRPCHRAIRDEWAQSTHATALRDLQFLAEIAKPDAPRWLCLNCHIPVQNQRRYMVTPATPLRDRDDDVRFIEEVPNPGFDLKMQAESITCASCHVRLDDAGRSVIVGPHAAPSGTPHPVREDRAALHAVCVRCHSPGPARITPTFFCWFQTADELAAGPWAGKADCVDCHMPRGADGRARHHWVGGGVPKWYAAYDSLLARGWTPGLDVEPVVVTRQGDSLRASVAYANARAGHDLPTADPERYLLLEVALVDEGGRSLADRRLRIGQLWDWGDLATGRPARRLADNRLTPGEHRTWNVTLPSPPVGARLVVSAKHVRLTVPNARYMRATRVDDLEPYLPGVASMVAEIEKHYPMFTWIHHEELDLDAGARSVWTPRQLVEASKRSRTLGLARLAELTSE